MAAITEKDRGPDIANAHDGQKELSNTVSEKSTVQTFLSASFYQRLTSWRARMVIHMTCAIIFFVILKINIPFALVCMLRKRGSNGTTGMLNSNCGGHGFGSETMSGRCANDSLGSEIVTSSNGLVIPSEISTSLTVDTGHSGQGEFLWSSSVEGLVLTSTGVLGFVMPLMVDTLNQKMGAKLLLLVCMVIASISTLLQPIGARTSPYVLITLRLVMGLCVGVVFPVVSEVFSWWAPPDEKVTMVSIAYSGGSIGNIVVSLTSGYMCDIGYDNGWPFIFYSHGAACLLWCLLFHFTGTVKPEDHPFISEDEKRYIVKMRLGMDYKQKRPKPPLKAMASSRPVWAFLIVMSVHIVMVTVLFNYVPLFLKNVLLYKPTEVGIISCIGYVVRFLGVVAFGQLCNLLRSKTRLSGTVWRKILMCGSLFTTGAGLVAVSFVQQHRLTAVILVTIAITAQGATLVISNIMPLDNAPSYSALLNGIANTLGFILATPAPFIASMITEHNTTEEWQTLLVIMAALTFGASTAFLFLASSKLQSWANPSNCDEEAVDQMAVGVTEGNTSQQTVDQMAVGVTEGNTSQQTVDQMAFGVTEGNTSQQTVDQMAVGVTEGNTSQQTVDQGAVLTAALTNGVSVSAMDGHIRLKFEKATEDCRNMRPQWQTPSSLNITVIAVDGSVHRPLFRNIGVPNNTPNSHTTSTLETRAELSATSGNIAIEKSANGACIHTENIKVDNGRLLNNGSHPSAFFNPAFQTDDLSLSVNHRLDVCVSENTQDQRMPSVIEP